MNSAERRNVPGKDGKRRPWILFALIILSVLLLVAGLRVPSHPHSAFEAWFGFYGVYAFLAAMGVVLLARMLRRVIQRDEHYYD